MTDATSISESRSTGRDPDETRTIADEAGLAFVRSREGDYVSPPGRKDRPNNGVSNRPRPLLPVARSGHTFRSETRPALPLLAVLARISLAIAEREAKTEDNGHRARQSAVKETAVPAPNAQPSSSRVSRIATVTSSSRPVTSIGTVLPRQGVNRSRRLATARSSKVAAPLAKRLTSAGRSGDD
jgi:hypothetical protein